MPPSPFFDLLNALSSLNVDKYGRFEIVTATYKILYDGKTQMETRLLIPKNLVGTGQCTARPVMVRIHGGFLVTGSSLYPPWFSDWILAYALAKGAIIISPDYRLLPEVSGREVLEDVDDFWKWFRAGNAERCLQSVAPMGTKLDYERVLVVGESAGGYCATHLGLSYPEHINALIAAYPMLDLRTPFYTEAYPKPIVGVPNMANQIIDDHLAVTSARTPITAADPPDRLQLAFAIVQNGRFLEFLGQDRRLLPPERLEDLAALGRVRFPTLFIFHGEQDSAVPASGSKKFIQLLRSKAPHVKAKLYIQNGDHGFDFDAGLNTPWLKDGLEMISQDWLRLHEKPSLR